MHAIHLAEPSPQRTPVLYQAGSSPRGRAFAARHAECVFVSGPSPHAVAPRVAAIRALAAEQGRRVVVFTMLTAILGETQAAARARHAEYQAHASHEGALALMSGWAGVDLSTYALDEPIRHVENDAGRSAMENITRADPSRSWTVRDVAAHVAIGGIGPVLVGTPASVADGMEAWIATGADLSAATLAEVTAIISAADPSLGQIPQNHHGFVRLLRYEPDPAKAALFFRLALEGARFGNALAETGGKTTRDIAARMRRVPGGWVVDGTKQYSTGALFAHYIPVQALDEDGLARRAVALRDAPGLAVVDDWSSFGQRTTASGTVVLDRVFVPDSHVIAAYAASAKPTLYGPVSQIMQAAIDLGIVRGAVTDTIGFVRTGSRPWTDSGQGRKTAQPRWQATEPALYVRGVAAAGHKAAPFRARGVAHQDADKGAPVAHPPLFERWYPGLANDNPASAVQTAAA